MDINLKDCHNALLWRHHHLIHINQMVYTAQASIPPTPSHHKDPSTWAAEHWKWFYEKMHFSTTPFRRAKLN